MEDKIVLASSKIIEGTPSDNRAEIEKSMTTETKKESDKWGQRASQSNALDLKNFYINCMTVEKMLGDTTKYANDGVERLFERHNVSKGSQRDYRNVAERIPKKLFASIEKFNVVAPGHHKLPITRIHLIRCANSSADSEEILELLRLTAENGWTDDMLSEEIRRRARIGLGVGDDETVGDKIRPTAATAKIQKSAGKLVEALSPLLSEDFLPRADTVQVKDMESALKNAAAAKEVLERLRDNLDDPILTLNSAVQVWEHKIAVAEDAAKNETKNIENKSKAPAGTTGKKKKPTKERPSAQTASATAETKKKKATRTAEGGEAASPRRKKRRTKKGAKRRPAEAQASS